MGSACRRDADPDAHLRALPGPASAASASSAAEGPALSALTVTPHSPTAGHGFEVSFKTTTHVTRERRVGDPRLLEPDDVKVLAQRLTQRRPPQRDVKAKPARRSAAVPLRFVRCERLISGVCDQSLHGRVHKGRGGPDETPGGSKARTSTQPRLPPITLTRRSERTAGPRGGSDRRRPCRLGGDPLDRASVATGG
jgi:hypothetical protein